jgi:hypothetical protein
MIALQCVASADLSALYDIPTRIFEWDKGSLLVHPRTFGTPAIDDDLVLSDLNTFTGKADDPLEEGRLQPRMVAQAQQHEISP